MSDYRPGTVAKVHDPVYGDMTAILIADNGLCWHGVVDGNLRCVRAAEVTDVRPLVVLDPEDREQAERLADAVETWLDRVPYSDMATPTSLTRTEAITEALRSLTKPPKPEEPTGLGAVVEDREEAWVHFGNGCWIKAVPNAHLRQKTWDDFSDAVEVVRP